MPPARNPRRRAPLRRIVRETNASETGSALPPAASPTPAAGPPRQATLPFKRASAGRRVDASEAVLQRRVVGVLRFLGYIVLETNEHRRAVRCAKCGNTWTPGGGSGTSKGIADLIVSHVGYPRYCFVAIEMKGRKTPWSSPAQKWLFDEKRNALARGENCIEAALQALADAEGALGVTVLQNTLSRRSVAVNAPIEFRDGSCYPAS
jgi:hypothetical protein